MWIRRALRTLLVVTAVGAASVAFTAPASAHTTHHPSTSTVKVTGGKTVLRLDAATAGVLTANGVSVAPIAGAYASGKGIAFPITGGKVTTEAVGTITHRGGLKFTAGKVSLGVQDFVIDTTKGVLTARVSGTKTRVPLLNLDLGDASIKAGESTLTVKNVHGTLTKEAAAALNKTFGVTLFKAGLPIGTATVRACF
jgi:Htaa